MKQYIINNLSILSQGLNSLLGGNPKESFSERVGRYYNYDPKKPLAKLLRQIINGLFKPFGQKDHVEKVLKEDVVKEVWSWQED